MPPSGKFVSISMLFGSKTQIWNLQDIDWCPKMLILEFVQEAVDQWNWCSKMPLSGIMQSVTMFFFSPHQSLCKTLLIGELGLAARCHILKLRIYTDTVDLK